MLRLAVFDDEYIVLQGIRQMIDWSRHGVELIGTAEDGYTALSVCRECRPDIIFTDIRMPGIDGLQLIEQILAEAPDSVCVVFSGFNEFEYVKRAIKIGVADYLEKPLTIAKFEEGLRKATDLIAQRREVVALKVRWEEGRRELLEKATWELLLTGAEAAPRWRECFGADDAVRVVGITVLAFAAGYPPLNGHPSYEAIAVRNGVERLLVVVHYEMPAAALWEQVSAWGEQSEWMIGSGRTYAQLSEAPCSYKEAQRALRFRWFQERPGWTRFEQLGEGCGVPERLSEREEAVIFHMRSGNREGLLQQLELFMDGMEAERLDPIIAERELLKMVYLGLEAAKQAGGNVLGLNRPGYSPHTELRELKTREEMFRWLRDQMELIMDWMKADGGPRSKHAAVEKALHYIADNFQRDLTLQEVAEHVRMNAAYFSLLFKEEVGISYIKHLTKVRIGRAKLLLREGLQVYEVSAQVGYYRYRHFTEVFKKHVGMTPGQYRAVRA